MAGDGSSKPFWDVWGGGLKAAHQLRPPWREGGWRTAPHHAAWSPRPGPEPPGQGGGGEGVPGRWRRLTWTGRHRSPSGCTAGALQGDWGRGVTAKRLVGSQHQDVRAQGEKRPLGCSTLTPPAPTPAPQVPCYMCLPLVEISFRTPTQNCPSTFPKLEEGDGGDA